MATSAGPVTGLALPADLDVAHLIRRTTYGTTPALRTEVGAAGPTAWLADQLRPNRVDDPGGRAVAAMFPDLSWSVATAVARLPTSPDVWKLMWDLCYAHLGRALWSQRQLLEVMVDFWSNHLNVTCPSDEVWHSRHRYDADVIRRHAFGRFEDMLTASATHPSMLGYLDNVSSTGENPNENYARELLELHTVGLGAHTETDVKQAALLLTGWTFGADRVVFDPSRHYVGPVTVLGRRFANPAPNSGPAQTAALTAFLATHPATARHLATKLAIRFVADDPPPALVNRLARTYLNTGTAIVPVLSALFSSPEFAASAGQKVRRPMERLVATARAVGVRRTADPLGVVDLFWTLAASGHLPLGWPAPNGYPDVAAAWQSPAIALDQFNLSSSLAAGWWPTRLGLPTWKTLVSPRPTTASGAVDAVARKVLGRPANTQERSAVLGLLTAQGLPSALPDGSWEQEATVGIAAQLLLTSTAHLTR